MCYTNSMKQLIIALLIISTTAHAQWYNSEHDLATPPRSPADLPVRGELPLPTGITRTVLVEGSGTTPTLARQDAFRLALERTMGIAIVTETQVNNQRIVRDQTATWTQARISNFAVASVGQRGSLYYTQVWVTVTN